MNEKKRFFRTLNLLLVGGIVSGFLLGFIVLKQPEGLELAGYVGFFGLWMVVAISSYMAIKSYFYNS
ncbi:MAG: hypothetical protein U9N42_01030 [Campylobacterota bacterium]|nr:hypothetical protein [Campylobacterota bacterium]